MCVSVYILSRGQLVFLAARERVIGVSSGEKKSIYVRRGGSVIGSIFVKCGKLHSSLYTHTGPSARLYTVLLCGEVVFVLCI